MSLEEKVEVDNRSIYVGNVSLILFTYNCKVSQTLCYIKYIIADYYHVI